MKTGLLEHNQNYINRWVVSYADFVTMLLAVFMVMYALSQMDLNNMKAFSSSINNSFSKSAVNIDNNQKLIKLFKTTQTKVYLDNSVSQKENVIKKQ
jgi:flagellar motor protein MotB